MLNENKCCSQKNIISSNKLNIKNSPIQYQNLNSHKRIPSQKENYKAENNIPSNKNTSNNCSFISIRGNRSPNSNFEKSNVGKYLIRRKYINQNNNFSNYNSKTHLCLKDDSKNKKIEISITEKNNTYSKRYDNRLKILTQGIKESFCYFKVLNNDNLIFDPLDNCSSAPENFGFIDGYISINVIKHKFKMVPKLSQDNNDIINELLNNDISFSNSNSGSYEGGNDKCQNYIGIELKDISDVTISREMKNIIRIHNAYIKYANVHENVNINRVIYSREINDIPMEHNQRIKAAFCNFFMFSLFFKRKSIPKVEFIFINYEQFNLWFNCLQYITKINNNQASNIISSKTYNANGSPKNKK